MVVFNHHVRCLARTRG